MTEVIKRAQDMSFNVRIEGRRITQEQSKKYLGVAVTVSQMMVIVRDLGDLGVDERSNF